MKISPFSKTYEGRCVLDFSGIELQHGRIYAIVGANGSGKSTFAKILAGILRPDKRDRLFSGGAIGYMPQKNYAFRMSTKANLLLNGNDITRANALMDAVQICHLASKRADRLSGGETARMALARLMMKQYDLVVLDEPTAAMDMETSLLAEKIIVEYVKKTGCALVLVTHSLQQARRIADEVLFFHEGRLLEVGTAQQMLTSPENDETKRFLEFYGF